VIYVKKIQKMKILTYFDIDRHKRVISREKRIKTPIEGTYNQCSVIIAFTGIRIFEESSSVINTHANAYETRGCRFLKNNMLQKANITRAKPIIVGRFPNEVIIGLVRSA
jgi:hypothetical protein